MYVLWWVLLRFCPREQIWRERNARFAILSPPFQILPKLIHNFPQVSSAVELNNAEAKLNQTSFAFLHMVPQRQRLMRWQDKTWKFAVSLFFRLRLYAIPVFWFTSRDWTFNFHFTLCLLSARELLISGLGICVAIMNGCHVTFNLFPSSLVCPALNTQTQILENTKFDLKLNSTHGCALLLFSPVNFPYPRRQTIHICESYKRSDEKQTKKNSLGFISCQHSKLDMWYKLFMLPK